MILFADDTNMFCSSNDPVQLSRHINTELDKLNKQFAINKLSLNLFKIKLFFSYLAIARKIII